MSVTKCLKPKKDGVSETGWPDLQREVSSVAEAQPWAFKGVGAEASESRVGCGPGGARRVPAPGESGGAPSLH